MNTLIVVLATIVIYSVVSTIVIEICNENDNVIAFFAFLALVLLTGIVYIFMLIIKIFDVNDHLPNFDPHHPFN